LLKNE